MLEDLPGACRFFLSYSGVKMPFKLVNELEPAQIENRNTFFRGFFDDSDRLTGFQKVVYGELELQHRYQYGEDGRLLAAEITDVDGEVTEMRFD